MSINIKRANEYILNFATEIDREGWNGQSDEYIRGVKETLSHINGLLTGSIQWGNK